MSAERCHREDELLESLGRNFMGPELESHLAACTACSELRLVAGALLDDRVQAMTEAHVPSSGTMWWRMRVRLRLEMEARARRSLYLGQAATLLVAIGLVVSFFGSDLAVEVRELVATVNLSTPLLLIAATWALAVPIAGWVAIRQK